jgi:hypothetical protein
MNYDAAISEFTKLRDRLQHSLIEGQAKVNVVFSKDHYSDTKRLINNFFFSPKNLELSGEVNKIKRKVERSNAATQYNTLIEFLTLVIKDLENVTARENVARATIKNFEQIAELLPKLFESENKQEVTKQDHVWTLDDLEELVAKILPHLPYGREFSIKQMLSNELNHFVPFLKMDQHGEVKNTGDLIEYMRRQGLIEKKDKTYESLTDKGYRIVNPKKVELFMTGIESVDTANLTKANARRLREIEEQLSKQTPSNEGIKTGGNDFAKTDVKPQNKVTAEFLAFKKRLEEEVPTLGFNDEGKAESLITYAEYLITKYYQKDSQFYKAFRRVMNLSGSKSYRLSQLIPVLGAIAEASNTYQFREVPQVKQDRQDTQLLPPINININNTNSNSYQPQIKSEPPVNLVEERKDGLLIRTWKWTKKIIDTAIAKWLAGSVGLGYLVVKFKHYIMGLLDHIK